MAGRHVRLLNCSLFLAVLGFILFIFGVLMYWSDDKAVYGTCFVASGGTAIIISMIVALVFYMRRRIRAPHIIDDPRIAYIYNQQCLQYNSRTGSLHTPTHSRGVSTTSSVLSANDLQIVEKSRT